MPEFEALENIIREVLSGLGLKLFSYSFSGHVLRIAIDKENGNVSLADCEQASRALEKLFDERDMITQHYTLEVSSPGLDRPLKTREDYARFISRKMKLAVDQEGKQLVLIGWIKNVTERGVELEFKDKESKQYAWQNIISGKLEIELRRMQDGK
ncbi:MAG: ribosome maturation factor RimP [bacterium]|nr:ribosome maturation factor RimP [bacterium]